MPSHTVFERAKRVIRNLPIGERSTDIGTTISGKKIAKKLRKLKTSAVVNAQAFNKAKKRKRIVRRIKKLLRR